MLYIGKIFNWIELSRNQYLRDLYKASLSAIVLTFINLAALAIDMLLAVGSAITLYYLIPKLIILVFLIFIACYYLRSRLGLVYSYYGLATG